ncbi:MAG: hypothetical protein M3P16_05175 [Chloroflexota bacterium]|nr:hypothetical protein [Chloroflexota bacterium]
MRETAAELAELQALIDKSHANTRPHMRGIIHPGKYSLTAKQVVKLLDGRGASAFERSEHGVYVRLDADLFYTYSRTPTEFRD